MVHATLVLQPLGKRSGKKHNNNTISKKFSKNPGTTKRSSTALKASPASAPDQLTTQGITNAFTRICLLTCQKFLSYQRRWKEYCTESNIIYESPTVEQKVQWRMFLE